MRNRVIYGCLGTELSSAERQLFEAAKPWGFILFGRNISDRDQVRKLIGALRDCVGDKRTGCTTGDCRRKISSATLGGLIGANPPYEDP